MFNKLTFLIFAAVFSLAAYAQNFPPMGGKPELKFEFISEVFTSQQQVDKYNEKLKQMKDENDSSLSNFESNLKEKIQAQMGNMISAGGPPDFNKMKVSMQKELKKIVDDKFTEEKAQTKKDESTDSEDCKTTKEVIEDKSNIKEITHITQIMKSEQRNEKPMIEKVYLTRISETDEEESETPSQKKSWKKEQPAQEVSQDFGNYQMPIGAGGGQQAQMGGYGNQQMQMPMGYGGQLAQMGGFGNQQMQMPMGYGGQLAQMGGYGNHQMQMPMGYGGQQAQMGGYGNQQMLMGYSPYSQMGGYGTQMNYGSNNYGNNFGYGAQLAYSSPSYLGNFNMGQYSSSMMNQSLPYNNWQNFGGPQAYSFNFAQ